MITRARGFVAIVMAAAVASAAAAGYVGAQAPKQVLSPSPEFIPDVTFRGSALTGWQPMGDATWKAENGEIVGTPTQPGGGWLVWNQPYQDVAFYARFKCDGP